MCNVERPTRPPGSCRSLWTRHPRMGDPVRGARPVPRASRGGQRPAGVSLLEVLFAIGIVAVGLLGLTAVLPVALRQMARGYVSDSAARVAANAAEHFDIGGLRYPANWRYANGGLVSRMDANNRYFRAFAIDPQFAAANSGVNGGAVFNPNLFPYLARSVAADPRMERITLLSGSSSPVVMRLPQADEIFTGMDDLVFDIPQERTLPPEAVLLGGKRQAQGQFSWIATLVPKLEADGMQKDLYTLSIVVFHRRNTSYSMFIDADGDRAYDPGETPTLHENIVHIFNGTQGNNWNDTHFHADGYQGGDVTLHAATAEELNVRSGDWLMLMGNITFGGSQIPLFRWYRVLGSDSAPEAASGPQYQLDVTLQGADWPYRFIDTASNPPRTQVLVMKNIVLVHEKTIRLESSSLW
jgi:type II secretory pathway pseudopilin PulG